MLDPNRLVNNRDYFYNQTKIRGSTSFYVNFLNSYDKLNEKDDINPDDVINLSRSYINGEKNLKGNLKDLILNYLKISNETLEIVPKSSDGFKVINKREYNKNLSSPNDYKKIGEDCGIFKKDIADRIYCEGFPFLFRKGAKLERALINFMIEKNVENGFEEVSVPTIVNDISMFQTGAFPRKKNNVYKIENENLYLNPTAEIQITNLLSDYSFSQNDLPLRLVGYSRSFRVERDKKITKYTTLHEFGKVELFKATTSDNVKEEYNHLLNSCREIIECLKLPYREILLSSDDMGIASKQTRDFEIYFPGSKKWVEISSCSMLGEFQSRRMNAKYKTLSGKEKYLHTLHGSGLSIPRVISGIIENYQNSSGSFDIPKVLKKYLR